jgi:hypothetical protein
MKKNDLALIVLIISISLVVSYFIVKAIIGNPRGKQTTAEVVDLISPDLVQPSSKIFNRDAINPTVVIQIGNPANQQPFGQ